MVQENHAVGSPGCRHLAGDDVPRGSVAERIDRLVAGDLDDPERLELLAWLDAEPARWRRCGLAFLEAQTWRGALAADDGASPALVGSPAASRGARPSFAFRPRWQMLLASASAAIAAFVLGWILGQRPAGFSEDAGMVAGGNSPHGSAVSSEQARDAASQVASAAGAPWDRATVSPHPSGIAYVRVRVGEGPNAREVVAPVVATAGNGSWDQAAQRMPDYVRRQWERQGYRVIEGRQTIPFKLADGRQVDVPVERVMLAYVGRPSL